MVPIKKRADFSSRKDRAKLIRGLRDANKRHQMLDDLFFALDLSQRDQNFLINKYGDDIEEILKSFFTGKGLDDILDQAHEDFVNALKMKRFNVSTKKIKPVKRQVKSALTKLIEIVIEGVKKLLNNKFNTFKKLADRSGVDAKSVTGRFMPEVIIKGKKYNVLTSADRQRLRDNPNAKVNFKNKKDLRNLWSELTVKDGGVGTIRYRDGKVYPLTAWANMRAKTTSQDTHRISSAASAKVNGIMTGKISDHSSEDSCKYREGIIVFFTQSDKSKYMRRFPNDKNAANIPTVKEVVNDKTHMFLWNCLHLIVPFPIQYLGVEDRQEEVNIPIPKVPKDPKKVDEEAQKKKRQEIAKRKAA